MTTRSNRLPKLVRINAIFGDDSRSAGFGGIVPEVRMVTLGYFVALKMLVRSSLRTVFVRRLLRPIVLSRPNMR